MEDSNEVAETARGENSTSEISARSMLDEFVTEKDKKMFTYTNLAGTAHLKKMIDGSKFEIWILGFDKKKKGGYKFTCPAIVFQKVCDPFNTTAIMPMSANLKLLELAGNILITKKKTGLKKDYVAITSQITIVDDSYLIKYCAKVPKKIVKQISEALNYFFGL